MNFGLLGAAGFVAPRHLKAIYETGNQLVAAVDPHDSVGILDHWFPEARFFTEVERFDRHLEKLRRKGEAERVHYISICTPNYLHDAHVRLALRVRAQAICEKPLVINPWNLDQLRELEHETGCRVYTVLQLRLLPRLMELKRQLSEHPPGQRVSVDLTYITRRGLWYHTSWKGDNARSGGLAMNIGVHFFDILTWLFGPCEHTELHLRQRDKLAGYLEFTQARVRWFLSVDLNDLPTEVRAEGGHAYRSLTIDGEELDLVSGFTGLHTRVYEDILAGGGFGIDEIRPAIELLYRIRTSDVANQARALHPLVSR